ncbi:unnamed protein product [Effrenium voratum]|uniref:Uncharacterized protein n=1 Tax=Effrenium voratum TaxID=2562239 RepID=A0AA36IDB3_9DINO|nr:unnamed protein product [Effrenium voratum]CAJ1449256.1 unnamed protein product [Effrenium voratum]
MVSFCKKLPLRFSSFILYPQKNKKRCITDLCSSPWARILASAGERCIPLASEKYLEQLEKVFSRLIPFLSGDLRLLKSMLAGFRRLLRFRVRWRSLVGQPEN